MHQMKIPIQIGQLEQVALQKLIDGGWVVRKFQIGRNNQLFLQKPITRVKPKR